MTSASVFITNLKPTPRSLDIKLSEDRVIRVRLAPAGTIGGTDTFDAGGFATLDELNRNPQMRVLLDNLDTGGNPDPLVSVSVARGTNDIPGSDSATAAPDAEGLGGLEIGNFRSLNTDGTDHVVVASMPFAAAILDIQLMVDTAEATTWTLRDAIAGGGNALSQALSTAATGRVRDDGTGTSGAVPTVSKGDPLVINKAAAASATGNLIVTFQRL